MTAIHRINRIWNISCDMTTLLLIGLVGLFLDIGTWIMFCIAGVVLLRNCGIRPFPLNSMFFRNQLGARVLRSLPRYKEIEPHEFMGLSERATGILDFLCLSKGMFFSCGCTRNEIVEAIHVFLVGELKCRIDYPEKEEWPTSAFDSEITATSLQRSIVYHIRIVQSRHHPSLFQIQAVVEYHKLGSLS